VLGSIGSHYTIALKGQLIIENAIQICPYRAKYFELIYSQGVAIGLN
jgi:hypothetical protein